MRNKLLTLFFLFFSVILVAQKSTDEEPQYPGGDSMMMKFIKRHRKLPIAVNEKVSCTINQNGFIINPVITTDKKSPSDSVTQREALRIVKLMPQWIPAKSEGKDVSKKITINVKYDIVRPPVPGIKNKDYDTTLEAHFYKADVMPEFNGGQEAMLNYIKSTMKYPDSARQDEIQGKVMVKFIVSKDGTLKNIQMYRGIGYGCNEEALRIVKSMPKWKPGMQNGKPVDVDYALNIRFTLFD